MCGINGLVYRQPEAEITARISLMDDLIIHRGPDDAGIHLHEQTLAMGMRRLSIIDLEHGHQPLYNNDRSIVIVFNGEIYNFRELRKSLTDKNVVFNTHSDTEVVLRMYELYGTDAFPKLNGMFALAIHDVARGSVILARDRFGEKPLYYRQDETGFAWASELKSLKRIFLRKPQIDQTALQLFLGLTYIPAPCTIYKDVYKLEAGHYLQLDTASMQHSISRYWDISLAPARLVTDYSLAKKELRSLLFDSVEKRMIADVPIGVFLSGGVDSTIIAAIMSELAPQQISTFSIGYENKRYDESERAQQVASHIGADHHSYLLRYHDILQEIDRIILNYDEPFADSSCLPTWFVSRQTAAHVKVALTGDGGDEVFGGYNKYLVQRYSKWYNNLVPGFIREKILEPAIRSNVWKQQDSRSLVAKARKFVDAAGHDVATHHLNIIALGFGKKEMLQLLRTPPTVDTTVILSRYLEQPAAGVEDLKLARYLDQHISLEGDMLTKVDRASMLCSLECRAPFLDHRLMEFSHQLPDSFLIKGNNKKKVLKDTFVDMLPPGFFNAPKSGFEVPVAEWFRNELKDDLCSTLQEQNLAKHDLFNTEFVNRLITDHLDTSADHSFKLWTLFCFQKWYHANME